MIVKRTFITGYYPNRKAWRGYFLFGIIPIYIEIASIDCE
jgi:hypothetical protein